MTLQDELDRLHAEIVECTNCPLHETRINAVPGEGAADARIVFVGEAPGAREDELGRPFVGRSGELLTELIEGIGLSRDDVFITSVLKSRPPNNRTPKKSEIDACISYLDRQLEIINPEVVVLLGGIAVFSLIGPWKMTDAHGRFYEGSDRKFFITYHPAAALRFPAIREVMEADFEILCRELG